MFFSLAFLLSCLLFLGPSGVVCWGVRGELVDFFVEREGREERGGEEREGRRGIDSLIPRRWDEGNVDFGF